MSTSTHEAPTGIVGRAGATLRSVLIDEVPRDHQQPDHEFHRRRVVVVIGLLIGTTLLGLSLATTPGSVAFYPLTISVAVVWVVFGFASGPLHLGYVPWRGTLRRPVFTPLALGLVASAVFVVGALIVAQIDPLRHLVQHVLAHEQQGNLALVYVVTLLNGAAEEVFFRGALFAAIGRRHAIPLSVVIYTLVTIATGNVMLVFAAVLMGTLFALQRRASGGIMASTITHLVWSVAMLIALPAIIGT
ncbi:CPBP family intramembrane glutamic endopeptidase [Jatrophihabitans endophyticus]|uniref:CPBP family intramembrane glutamic endopeptidase n=1 Tax=Jatrophihabitans endophyticus TaxID=1206085 RepID=UPI0026EFB0AA|nr:type II CAAX endopeptidase family protein [Jatrophihabitans endophyticus]